MGTWIGGSISFDKITIIGRGAFAVVFKGRYNDTTDVAIKRIQRSVSARSWNPKSEVEALNRLRGHSNIVNFFEWNMDEDFW